jgi:arginyl-tRNA synthetase
MIFNPEESIDFHGFTGPFVQYTYARIKSILRKDQATGENQPNSLTQAAEADLLPLEKSVVRLLERYPSVLEQACAEMNPSLVAIYAFQLAKQFNSFYSEHSVNRAETSGKRQLRRKLSLLTASVLRSSMSMLGINVPERM